MRLSDKPMVVAVDSTGVRVHKAGGCVERRYGKKNRYVKIHLAVDVETKQAVAMIVTINGTHDSRVFPQLLRKTERRGKVSKVIMDVIKPGRNSRTDTPSEPRREAVTQYKHLAMNAGRNSKAKADDGAWRQRTPPSSERSESSVWRKP